MDIFNRPPAISEDTLQYTIYPAQNVSDKAAVTTFAAVLIDYVDILLPDHIWHRDAFEVKVVPHPEVKDNWILEGRMRVGDSVDDEWCTVWLLKEISSQWDLVISVFDSDGEFLLIEAAEVLPLWVQPKNSENRVWIYASRLHLIPLSHSSPPSRKRIRRKILDSTESDNEGSDNDDEFITPDDAVKLVQNPFVETLAPPIVEKAVWERISGYPAARRKHVHTTNAYIPIDIAKALVARPHLVQKSVEAFYTRDAIQLRAAHRMLRLPPGTSVLQPVKMTRTAYAQLLGQKFFPPKVFGRWQEKEGTREWRWRDVGMKIAVGFEILYQESKGKLSTSNITIEGTKSSAEAAKDALRRTPEYQKFLQNLVSANYFKGEVEGSELWRELENKAAITFVEVRQTDNATRQSFASQVDAAASETISPSTSNQTEDDDEWLNLDSEDFEQMLQSTVPPAKNRAPNAMEIDTAETAEDRTTLEQADRLKELATKVEDFVEGEGDLEGARFEDEEFSDDPFSDDDSEKSMDTDPAERQAAMDQLIPALDPSEYGQMPASYHSNSQRVAPVTVIPDLQGDDHLKDDDTNKSTKVPAVKERPIRKPILPRDNFDGVVDSDDETDEEAMEDDDESEEDRPQVVGEIDIDMGEEEAEFLEFSRQALGLSDEEWNDIVRDRKGRGAFLPESATLKPQVPLSNHTPGSNQSKSAEDPGPRVPMSGPRPNVNPKLDSFETVMEALDQELARNRRSRAPATKAPETKGKGKEKTVRIDVNDKDEDEDEDIDAAMEAELKATLEQAEDEDEDSGEASIDYNLIKNFLESFKSQGGLSGPVGSLAGRLQPGWKLPRDNA
ncbi:uncharacterized protein LACBIDRAFT_301759 [Laccaria bicolor S238N-H82]|uniref:Predicted protein n=1 Tax=Laccaria bicolor (strain S238N-H82 / ATCC MYA-4686) TaxID=486041 RepID=B0CP80_LACBS|nr:uncharacterized protein LACBIDRAFT_301759 [Laccaria bicolor S238N-H82]EDR15436.1 predicted protein [Laccaria bicolor S238N-H82]|eukprot:XP_001873644.1 predicted protein [Laccaria bicolor S238N-H82]